ncbi:hypothetical protein [Pseudonocardia humida]|uniref:Uncharacterized protein n=1 Tax=Pseudonocardia humida TaxID=2800819 RepID=A0ABT1A6D2_9PSEU|nr:hypothetical protein [Pseudonocardia humida]MCO1658473.1 hypothetical protein [Pseudonocardia humida]
MAIPPHPDPPPDGIRESVPAAVRASGPLSPGDDHRASLLLVATLLTGIGGFLVPSLVIAAVPGSFPVGWLALPAAGLALALVFLALYLGRVGSARPGELADDEDPTTTTVRVARPEDRTRPGPRAPTAALSPGARPAPPSTTVGQRSDPSWPGAAERFAHLRGEYAAFECDPVQVLRTPALTDTSVPSTARFVDAFADAQSLATDRYPGVEHARRFVEAADRAERTWTAAREAAERIRLSGLPPAERSTVERVIKLLTTARDSDSEPERLVAYARARSELARLDRAGVVHVPRVAQAALAEAARGQLPA